MKKKIVALMVVVMLSAITFTACGTKQTKNNTNSGDQSSNTGDVAKDDSKSEDNGDKKETGGTLIVGTEAGFAPYEYMQGNEVVGIDMDIAKAIADDMGKKLEIKNMNFDGALMAVQNGTVDMVAAGVSVSDERKEVMDFSIEYVNSTEVIVVNKENPAVTGVTVDDLAGKIVGVQQGNIADFYVEENTESKEIKRYTKFVQAAEDLKNHKIDCIVMDKYPAEELVASNEDLVIVDGTLFEDKYAIAVKKGNQELLDEINKVIQNLIDEGKIEEFTANHTAAQE